MAMEENSWQQFQRLPRPQVFAIDNTKIEINFDEIHLIREML
jgi:hypothetical protein